MSELGTDGRTTEVVTDRTSSDDEHHHVDTGLPPIAPVQMTKTALLSESVALTKDGDSKSPKHPVRKPTKMKRPKKVNNPRRNQTKGISQASALKLFQCSCQLLRTQALDYDVRAREMEDRNAKQAKDLDDWEQQIRSLKRELDEYPDEAVALEDEQLTSEASLPPAVAAAEAKLQEELRKRTLQLDEFCRTVPGFVESLDDQF
ncbi:Hypothetical protein PHPALM_6043 [Phytophthora palmivora]|uniref:Uncharacterized protein n=1 Tax=Phytophthora palmivora TaxID=4796 RepID=A0A2P4YFW5_9STRA|nr:Hypothetical protein PHPALM_6043 [Phytophthora palmivora]